MPGLADSLLATVTIQSVTVETQLSPPYTYTPGPSGAPTTPQGGLGAFNPLAFLKPKFTVVLANGSPIVVAPYGEPSGNYLPHALGGVGLLVAAIALYKGAKAIAKTAGIIGGGLVLAGYLQNQNQAQGATQ